MPSFKRIGKCALGGVLSLIPLSFGIYIVYERSMLAVLTGATEERYGILERASEPISFWISVVMYGLFGGLIALSGLWGLWAIIKYARTHIVKGYK